MFLLYLFSTWNMVHSSTTLPPSTPRPFIPRTIFLSNRNCYKSVSNPRRLIEVFTAHPRGPAYLRTFTTFKMYFKDSNVEPLELKSTHHYMRVDQPCSSTLTISTLNKEFSHIDFNMQLYNDLHSQSLIGDIFYTIKNSLKPTDHKFMDTRWNFAIQIGLRHSGREHFPSKSDDVDEAIKMLKKIQNTGGLLCLIAPGVVGVAFQPVYPDNYIPRGVITHIDLAYYKDGNLAQIVEFPAFECFTNKAVATHNAFIVDDFEFVSLRQRMIRSTEYEHQSSIAVNFNFPGEQTVIFRNSGTGLMKMKKKVYLMKQIPEKLKCSDGSERSLYKSLNGTVYLAEKLIEVEIGDLKRKEWYLTDPKLACSV